MVRITGRTRLAGLVGWPVASSRSPLIHNEWLRRAAIDGAYVPLPVRPGHLRVALEGLRAAGFAGVNVTVPHKEDAFRLCDTTTGSARCCGSTNTLVFRADGTLHGDSSDGQGFLQSLRAEGIAPGAGPALLLGAGGAARAIAAALLAEGVAVTISNRTRARAEVLAASLADAEADAAAEGSYGRRGGTDTGSVATAMTPVAAGRVAVLDWKDRGAALAGHALLVNTTTIGMGGDPATPCPLDRASSGLVVADIVYVPRVTPLLAEARVRGLRTVEGLGMLLHQAGVGFASWFGTVPQVDDALAALVRDDLDRR